MPKLTRVMAVVATLGLVVYTLIQANYQKQMNQVRDTLNANGFEPDMKQVVLELELIRSNTGYIAVILLLLSLVILVYIATKDD